MCPKDEDVMANSVDPDQTTPEAVRSGSTLFAQTCLSENIMVYRKDDQTMQMCRLLCASLVQIWHKQVFS